MLRNYFISRVMDLLIIFVILPFSFADVVPVDVLFQKDNIYRSVERGDNWCITWAADDSQITSMCDGNWLSDKQGYHNHLYRILGGPIGFSRQNIPGYPQFVSGTGSWFGYGIITTGDVIYSAVSKTPKNRWSGPFRGIKLLKSTDNGKTWYRVNRRGKERLILPSDEARNEVNNDEMFFLEESGLPHQTQVAYPFSFISFVHSGRANQTAKDDYIYIYSPEGAHVNQLLLARVHKEKIGHRNEWEYFKSYDQDVPLWTHDLAERGVVYTYPEASKDGRYFGWYSWLPSIVWNEGLGLYIMVNGGTYAGHGMTNSDQDYYDPYMHMRSGSLGFWYSKNPYGPWTQFYYNEDWIVDDEGNRTYQPKLSPKWISEDGKNMVLIWSDAMKNEAGKSHTVNYKWNQMKISIVVGE